jgi:hypothetical protein
MGVVMGVKILFLVSGFLFLGVVPIVIAQF